MVFFANRPIPDSFESPFTAGLNILDAVYEKSDGNVDKADASSSTTGPCIGFVIDIPGSTAKIQHDGIVEGFSGLVEGDTYFLDTTPGQITNDVSGFGPPNVIQKVGVAQSPTALLLFLDRDTTELVA